VHACIVGLGEEDDIKPELLALASRKIAIQKYLKELFILAHIYIRMEAIKFITPAIVYKSYAVS